jgi:hypothetical protein
VAALVGSAGARFAGVGIDELNDVSENLGYKMILVAVAVSFATSALILAKISKDRILAEPISASDPLVASSAPD